MSARRGLRSALSRQDLSPRSIHCTRPWSAPCAMPRPTSSSRSFARIPSSWASSSRPSSPKARRPSDRPPGDNAPDARRAATLLTALGFEVERHAVPDDEAAAAGLVSVTNLVVRCRFGAGPTVALNAHGDVVPPGGGWTHDPYAAEIDGGRMYGRGVAVSKSDFATYAFALCALKAAGRALRGCVEL